MPKDSWAGLLQSSHTVMEEKPEAGKMPGSSWREVWSGYTCALLAATATLEQEGVV